MSNIDAERAARGLATAASDSPGDDRRVYHLGPARLCLLPLLWLAIAVPLLWLAAGEGSSTDDTNAFGVAAALFSLVMLAFQAIAWHSRLVLTPAGIAHHQFGYTIRSGWDNVQALSLAPGAQGLRLRRSGTNSRLLYWATRFAGALMPRTAEALFVDAELLATGRLILLTPFMSHWRRGTLPAALLRWAPHLFDAATRPQAPDAEGPWT